MKLKVGKIYRARDRSFVTITGSRGADSYPYSGDNGLIYTATGAYSIDNKEHEWDLIEEVPTKKEQTMKLEVGKSYKNREGGIVSIVHYWHTHVYPYQDESGNTYLEDGTALQGQISFRDLVEEHFVVDILGDKYTFKATAVEEPKQQEEKPMQDQIVTLNCTLTVTTAYGEPILEIYPKEEGWRASSVCTVLDANFELVLPRDKIDTLYTDKLLLEVQTADEAYQKALQALGKANKFLDSL